MFPVRGAESKTRAAIIKHFNVWVAEVGAHLDAYERQRQGTMGHTVETGFYRHRGRQDRDQVSATDLSVVHPRAEQHKPVIMIHACRASSARRCTAGACPGLQWRRADTRECNQDRADPREPALQRAGQFISTTT
jgi:hypothetical protein